MTPEVLIALIGTMGGVATALISQGRKLNRIENNSQVIRDQTENEHAGAEFPNLRDELTALHVDVRGLRNDVLGLHDVDVNLDDTMTRQDIRTQRAIDRAMATSDQQIDRLREEIPVMIRREVPRILTVSLTKHVSDCPLRTPEIGG